MVTAVEYYPVGCLSEEEGPPCAHSTVSEGRHSSVPGVCSYQLPGSGLITLLDKVLQAAGHWEAQGSSGNPDVLIFDW